MSDLNKVIRERSEHLNWIYDRMVHVHGENENVDYLRKFRSIIDKVEDEEDDFAKFLEFIDKKDKVKPQLPSLSELYLVERDDGDGRPFTAMYRTLKRAKGGHPDNKLYRFKFDCEIKKDG
jgi:hypothetical protein